MEVNERRGAECDLADKLALADQRRRDMEVDRPIELDKLTNTANKQE